MLRGSMKKNKRTKKKARIEFGKRVYKRRKQLGLSQEKLAFEANLHRNYVGSVERGERNISLDNILLLATALKCSPSDLFL